MTELLDAPQRKYRYEVIFTDGTRAKGRTINEMVGFINQFNGAAVASRQTVTTCVTGSRTPYFKRLLLAIHVDRIHKL